jgi:hypothetical protein
MNERVKELFIQLFGKNNFPKGNAEVYMSAEDLEKFAELMIRECADLVVDDDNAFDILKHFGVE